MLRTIKNYLNLRKEFMTIFKLEILNEKGLHARASAKFVELVESFNASCAVRRDSTTVSGDSIMGLLMLSASKHSILKVKVSGPEKIELKRALQDLISKKFGEDN